MRKFASWYLKGLFMDKEILDGIYQLTEKNALQDALRHYLGFLIAEGRLYPEESETATLDTNDCYVHKEKKDH